MCLSDCIMAAKIRHYIDNQAFSNVKIIIFTSSLLPHTSSYTHRQRIPLAEKPIRTIFSRSMRSSLAWKRTYHRVPQARRGETPFISTISHELKPPISAILMIQQLLTDNHVDALNAEQKELSDSIRENGEHHRMCTYRMRPGNHSLRPADRHPCRRPFLCHR